MDTFKPTSDRIKEAITQYEDGLITGYECLQMINVLIKGVDGGAILDEHYKIMKENGEGEY